VLQLIPQANSFKSKAQGKMTVTRAGRRKPKAAAAAVVVHPFAVHNSTHSCGFSSSFGLPIESPTEVDIMANGIGRKYRYLQPQQQQIVTIFLHGR
jgi:hypothetical protein